MMFGCAPKKNSSEVSFTELQSLQALRHLENLALQSFELRCVAAPGRAEVARLKWHKRFYTDNVSDSSGSKVSAFFFAPLSAGLVFFLRSRTHLRTLQLWFVSLPGKGLGACLVDRITGRSGLDDGIARCSGLNIGLFGRALEQLQNLEERQCC